MAGGENVTLGLRYPGAHRSDKPAVVMAGSDEVMTYAELDAFAWRAARAFRTLGLGPGAHVAFVIENRVECPAVQWGAHYAGLYFTFVGTRLTPAEAGYIVGDCGAAVVLLTATTAPGLVDALRAMDDPPVVLTIGEPVEGLARFEELMEQQQPEPFPDAVEGSEMLYSSGTTGRPKGVKPSLSGQPLGTDLILADIAQAIVGLDSQSVYLSPAPYYHAAPCNWVRAVTGVGATAVLMRRFDAEASLAAIDAHGITHSQWVPTMFLRMLRLPDEVKRRYSLSTHRAAIHAAAPCPPQVKQAMIEWWGPIIHEYYAGTEGIGLAHCTTEEWLAHPGTVGKAVYGSFRILDDDRRDVPPGEEGLVCFEGGREFRYHNDDAKTDEAYLAAGCATIGDIGRLDADGFLHLTDRRANMIISGGVNIYPQESENLLQTHPSVHDVAVVGVPNSEFGEEVRAVVHPADGVEANDELERTLIDFCRRHLASIKCPKQIDFREDLPREPTGKLLKRKLRDEYWAGRESRLT
jgi:fatty-acyl-CoA synthase